MLDLMIIRERLRAVRQEIDLTAEARAWADGSYRPQPGEVLPMPASSEGWAAWNRAIKRVASYGPRIVATYVSAAVSDVNWTGDSSRLDRSLAELPLAHYARRIVEELLIAGVAAGYVYEAETGLRIGLLGGYIAPYTDPWDRDVVTGLYQAALVPRPMGPPKYWVRVWDTETEEVREWRDLDDPTGLGRPPTRVLTGLVPRWRWWALSEAGIPTSPILQAVPVLRAIMATQLMMARLEEMSAYPIPVFGMDTEAQEIGPGLPIRGEFRWATPGSLEELREQYATHMEFLRDLLALPGGSLGGQTPSGEALREANIRFRSNVRRLAAMASELLSELVADYADALGVDAAQVAVIPSPDLERDNHVQRIISLYKEGLIPIRTALMEIQPYLPMLTDDVLDEFARRMEGVSSPEQLARLLGG